MLVLKGLLLTETVIIALLAWLKNRDPFSPVKIYLMFSTFFFAAIYYQDVRWETLVCYALLVQSIAFSLFFERKVGKTSVIVATINFRRLYTTIWLLSLPGMATMIYFVYEAGGLLQYLLSLAYRVQTWKGQGYFVILLNTLPTLNLIYFAGIIQDQQRKSSSVILYVLHFVILLMVGLLTASRSYIGVSLFGMCVIWTYLVRIPKYRYILMLAGFLVAFASVMGTIRNDNYGGEAGEGFLEKQAEGGRLENAQMGYGVSPLEIVFKSPEKVFLGGLSYLSLFTNLIPRVVWPGKPDTGGVIFTRAYTDDQSGFSYLATGAITEAILNFGTFFGIAFGVFANLFVFLCGCVFYNRVISKYSRPGLRANAFGIVAYFYVILTFARFSYGEFTDIFQSLIFFNLVPLGLVNLGLRFKLL